MKPIRPLAFALAVLLCGSFAAADVLVLTNRAQKKGGIHRDDEGGVGYNPYFSRNPGMVFDIEVFPRSQVKEVVLTEPPFQEFLRRMKEIPDEDIDGLLALAEWCKEEKLKEERGLALLRILARDPEHEAALKSFGRSKFKPRGDPDLDPEARAAIDAYLEIRDPDERAAAYGRLKRDASVSLPQHQLDRMIRAKDQKTGREDDRALTLGTAESPGVYSIFVPKEYDPRRAWPLVLGLHGGGPGGKEGDAVVGSGSSAMNFYVEEAAARGYIVVCPTAHSAGWGSRDNLDLIRFVLSEVELLYHIDLNRVYLTGHSMGGFGAWSVGEQMPELFAAVSPMAGGGAAWNRLVETSTPLFIFHGADDGVVGPDRDRAAARALAKTNHDFVYTELAGVGHGFPPSIRKDLFDFFDVRRLAEVRGRQARPPSALVRSSFAVKVGKDEVRYLGDPTLYGGTGGGDGGKAEVKALLKDLRLGGGKAIAAADRLGELRESDAVKPLSEMLRHPETADDVRIQAARALGLIGDADGYRGLAAGLDSDHPEVFAASARAMASIGAPKGGAALTASFGHLVAVLEKKRIGKNQIHITDWERWLAAFEAAVIATGELRPDGAVPAIRAGAVKKAVCGDWDVMYSPRVGQDPKAARRKLAVATAGVLGALGGKDAVEALEEMKAGCGDDPEIVKACDAALAR